MVSCRILDGVMCVTWISSLVSRNFNSLGESKERLILM